MGKEIERKFLVRDDSYKASSKRSVYKQGYLNRNPERTVRVRVKDNEGFITVKGKSKGATRLEYEYKIPVFEAEEMLALLCERPVIEKYRYEYIFEGFTWEIDEFQGENEGLVVAEIELQGEGIRFTKPDWVGEEVTGDPRYFNSSLVKHPYKNW